MVQLYHTFESLDPSIKFYLTVGSALFIFLYKALYSIFVDDEKQSFNIKMKKGEVLAKLEAAIEIYEASQRQEQDKDKLIEKFADCFMYVNWKTRQKIRLFYSNRSDTSLATLKRITSKELDTCNNSIQDILIIETMFSSLGKILRPILPLILFACFSLISIAGYVSYERATSIWEKTNAVCTYIAIIFSVGLFLGMFNMFFERGFNKNFTLFMAVFTLIYIFAPIVFFILYNINAGVVSLSIQFIYYIFLYKTSKSIISGAN